MAGQVISKIVAGDGSNNLITNSLIGSLSFGSDGVGTLTLFDTSVTQIDFSKRMTFIIQFFSYDKNSSSYLSIENIKVGTNSISSETRDLIYLDDYISGQDLYQLGIVNGGTSAILIWSDDYFKLMIDSNNVDALNISNATSSKITSWSAGTMATIPTFSTTASSTSGYDKLVLTDGNSGTAPSLSYSTVTASYVTR